MHPPSQVRLPHQWFRHRGLHDAPNHRSPQEAPQTDPETESIGLVCPAPLRAFTCHLRCSDACGRGGAVH